LLGKTSNKKYEAMLRSVCPDGRIRGLVQFYGANRTGRWAGRIVQLQNLPQNHIPDLDFAKQLVMDKDIDGLRMFYENVPNVLSELIRTALVAKKGHTFVVADFAAIEARVIAWLAGEKWRLDTFRGDGKIYEKSASMAFGIPVETITKGSELRQKGKVMELACGYQGGVGALKQMGGEAMGLSEDEMKDIVQRWRSASPNIVRLWYALEQAAARAIEGYPQTVGCFHLMMENGCLMIKLPSGRNLVYRSPDLEPHPKFAGKRMITFWGLENGQYVKLNTYGGKLAENCLGGGAIVLTDRGPKAIVDVTTSDRVWDGVEWVAHEGLVYKGSKYTIQVDGVNMTVDHRILTEEGWKDASQSEGYNRAKVTLPSSPKIHRVRWKEVYMGSLMRLREPNTYACQRVQKRKAKKLWVSKRKTNLPSKSHSPHDKPQRICCMAEYESKVYELKPQSMEKLWRSRYFCQCRMAREFRQVLGGYGALLQSGARTGQSGQQSRLCKKQLPVGVSQSTKPEQKDQHSGILNIWRNHSSRTCGVKRGENEHSLISHKTGSSSRITTRETGRTEPVYDLLNAGPRHRFTILGDAGPLIVHNCTQAVARDCLAEVMMKIRDMTVGHVHDEVILEVPEERAQEVLDKVIDLMGKEIKWAKGLPLKGDGYITPYYKKD